MDLILNFKRIEDSKGETLTCVLCGKVADESNELDYRRADISIATKVTVTIHVCGELCEKNLIASKSSMARLKHGVMIAKKENRMRALKIMGRRFGMIALIALASCAYQPKPTKPQNLKPRKYNKEYIDWLNAEYPLKEVTGTKKRRSIKNR